MEQRRDAVKKFTDGTYDILVSILDWLFQVSVHLNLQYCVKVGTDLVARGLNFPCISYVINFDLPWKQNVRLINILFWAVILMFYIYRRTITSIALGEQVAWETRAAPFHSSTAPAATTSNCFRFILRYTGIQNIEYSAHSLIRLESWYPQWNSEYREGKVLVYFNSQKFWGLIWRTSKVQNYLPLPLFCLIIRFLAARTGQKGSTGLDARGAACWRWWNGCTFIASVHCHEFAE